MAAGYDRTPRKQRGLPTLIMDYNLIKTKRKTISLSVNNELQVIVRAPIHVNKKFIDSFVEKHIQWIEKQKKIIQNRNNNCSSNALSKEDIAKLKALAKDLLPKRVKYYSDIMGVSPSGIKITFAKSRWGSCSYKNSLCFSYRVMLLPLELIDLIVVHELAHIRVKDHSKRFYDEVYKYMPDYNTKKQSLRKLELTL